MRHDTYHYNACGSAQSLYRKSTPPGEILIQPASAPQQALVSLTATISTALPLRQLCPCTTMLPPALVGWAGRYAHQTVVTPHLPA